MKHDETLHSICRWTFHAGKGGFVPANMRPAWAAERFGTPEMVRLVRSMRSRLPSEVTLGVELHYDNEVSDANAREVSDVMTECGLTLAMITPGAHGHFAYGGPASLDPRERERANEFSQRTVTLAYGALRKVWHKEVPPTLVLWNGSYGYDLATVGVRWMYQHLKESLAALCTHEAKLGGELFIGIEPKPNEGHPAMLVPTVASAIALWQRVFAEFGVSPKRKGVNMEVGHSEMIGLDPINDLVEQLEADMVVHIHLNSQGWADGILLGGPGKYDIDHGVRINGMNLALAGLLRDAGYRRWKGHDMQVRPYDSELQGIERVVRSVLSWHVVEQAAARIDYAQLKATLAARDTARAEDIMRTAMVEAQQRFQELYRQG